MTIEIRPFKRSDRDQVTALVNAHIGAVLPGISVSVNVVMSQLERDPAEVVVDPWVTERRSLVAVEHGAVVAAAHLLRYGTDETVGPDYRDAGEIKWLVCRPSRDVAGRELLARGIEVMNRWGVARQYADGALPSPVTYGICDSWPHLRALYESAGFAPTRDETMLAADIADLPHHLEPPLAGLSAVRATGDCGVRFSATRENGALGFIEVQSDMTRGGTRARLEGWGEIAHVQVDEGVRRKGVGRWLVGAAADWLRLGKVERVLAYASPTDDEGEFLRAVGFHDIGRTRRGWRREVS